MTSRIYASIETATRAWQRRIARGERAAVEYHDDLRNFEGGYLVVDFDDDDPLHKAWWTRPA